jgi:CMP-N-acetylneuraminic acid synthetase
MTRLRVLGLIPARGGSKGVVRKNIRPLAGRPLLQYTAERALAARSLSRVVLSTDDEVIAEAGRRCGLEVPFLRPAELARDDTPMLPVVQHALEQVERGSGDQRYDAVCLLQPTVPFRSSHEIDDCVALLDGDGVDTVITVRRVPAAYHPHWVFLPAVDGWLRISTGGVVPVPSRQELPPAYHRDGSVYVIRRSVLAGNRLLGDGIRGLVLESEDHVNIDGPADWARAQRLATVRGRPEPLRT